MKSKINKEKMKIDWSNIDWDDVFMNGFLGTLVIGFAGFVLMALIKLAMFWF